MANWKGNVILKLNSNLNEYYDFVKDLLDNSKQNRILIISRLDESGNIAAFKCIKKKNNILCGGHINLYNNQTKKLEISFKDFLIFLEYLQNKNVQIIFKSDFFLNNY